MSIRLQPGEEIRFQETQRFIQNRLLQVILALDAVVTTLILFVIAATQTGPQGDRIILVVWVVCVLLIPALIFAAGMKTVISDRRLVVRWMPPLPGRDVPLERIISAEPVTFAPLSEGGWGWRISPTYHRLFNVAGNEGVHVRMGEGRREQFLLGSQRAEALAAALRAEKS